MFRGLLGAARTSAVLLPRYSQPLFNVAKCSTTSAEDWGKLPLKIFCMDVHFEPLPELVPPEFDKRAYLAYFRQSRVFMAFRTTEHGPTAGGKNFFDVDDEPYKERVGGCGVILHNEDDVYALGKRLHMHGVVTLCGYTLEKAMPEIHAWVMQQARGPADAIGDEPDQVRMLYCLDCDPPDIREMEEVWRRPVDAEEIKERVLDFEEDYEDDYED